MSRRLKVVDLFAGVGGLSYGFYHNDAFELVAANEILAPMAQAYSLNHPDVHMYQCDIKELTFKRMRDELGLVRGDVDIVIGGPPCQAYSTVGRRVLDDERGRLFQEYYRLLKEIRPRVFLYENVRGLLSIQGGVLIDEIIGLFSSLGYTVRYQVLNAADFGVPQLRERVIITGTLLSQEFSYPEPTHSHEKELHKTSKKPYLNVADAIGDLAFIESGGKSTRYAHPPQNDFQRLMRQNAPVELADHDSAQNNPRLIELMQALPDGGSPRDLPLKMRPASGYGNTYCKLWWDRPATTITRNLGTPSSSRCIHPKVARALTTREGARLQAFPDDFQFFGPRSERNLQIGNAVPPLLSQALATSLAEYMERSGS